MTDWADAVAAAQLFAVDPAGTGIALRAPAGPARTAWLALLDGSLPTRPRRVPLNIRDDRLLGGLDLAATLTAGRPISTSGLLAEAEGGVLLLAMAERLPPGTAAKITNAADNGASFGIIALDEGATDEECPPPGLLDRLAFPLTLDDSSLLPLPSFTRKGGAAKGSAGQLGPWDGSAGRGEGQARTELGRARLPHVTADDTTLQSLCTVAAALGVASMRAPILALRAAKAAAALAGRTAVTEEDVTLAARLVFAPRATQLPDIAEPDQPEPEPSDTPDPDPTQGQSDKPLEDRVLDAATAAIPPGLLAQLADQAGRGRAKAGAAGALHRSAQRGRPAGVRPGDPRRGLRLNLIETLRAAAPWQGIRRAPGQTTVAIRPADFRVTHLKQRSETTTIFVVDASGSAALNRLAEAKGAVELLLAECYVRRDRVAVLAFRGRAAQLLLPPTRSLVRAKRSLASLPGGGGTPLAAGIDAGAALAADVRRRGGTPTIVLLTDGRANVARDGRGNRARAEEEALAAARTLRGDNTRALLIDTSPRPHAPNERLAVQMGARYVPLPYADAAAMSRAIQANR